jgi:hypothetical protein
MKLVLMKNLSKKNHSKKIIVKILYVSLHNHNKKVLLLCDAYQNLYKRDIMTRSQKLS